MDHWRHASVPLRYTTWWRILSLEFCYCPLFNYYWSLYGSCLLCLGVQICKISYHADASFLVGDSQGSFHCEHLSRCHLYRSQLFPPPLFPGLPWCITYPFRRLPASDFSCFVGRIHCNSKEFWSLRFSKSPLTLSRESISAKRDFTVRLF